MTRKFDELSINFCIIKAHFSSRHFESHTNLHQLSIYTTRTVPTERYDFEYTAFYFAIIKCPRSLKTEAILITGASIHPLPDTTRIFKKHKSNKKEGKKEEIFCPFSI